MKTYVVPHTDLTVPSVVLGLMRIAKMSDADIQKLVGTALDRGITFFDHADVYGGALHRSEERFAEAMKLTPGAREKITLQSKAGINISNGPAFFDFSAEHILEAVDGSLKALKTDYLDVLLLHRPDTLMEPEEVASAFDKLEAAGKVRHFGVSNQTPGQIELLKIGGEAAAALQPGAALDHPRQPVRARDRGQHERARPVGRCAITACSIIRG